MPPVHGDVRRAATTIVVRDSGDGSEVLLLRRSGRSGFAAKAWVFPGGVVDDADRTLEPSRWEGIDPPALRERFDVDTPADVLGFHVAAVRETFEEAGLLLARHADGSEPDMRAPGVVAMRRALVDRDDPAGAAAFAAWLRDEDLVLGLDRIDYFSRWVTPRAEPRRYDTCFFVAEAPPGQDAAHDRVETTEQRWISPARALEEFDARRLLLIFPTIRTLQALRTHNTVAGLREAARRQDEIRSILPHAVVDDEGRPVEILHPDDEGYPAQEYA